MILFEVIDWCALWLTRIGFIIAAPLVIILSIAALLDIATERLAERRARRYSKNTGSTCCICGLPTAGQEVHPALRSHQSCFGEAYGHGDL